MLDVYRQALLFQMKRLEHLCVEYFKACISHRNVLVVLQSAARLKLEFIKVCLVLSFSNMSPAKAVETELYIFGSYFKL